MPRILLDYPGIKGESLIRNYKNLINCESFDLVSGKRDVGGFEYDDPTLNERSSDYATSSSQSVSAAPRKDKRNLGVDSLTLKRRLDLASPKLMQAAFSDPVKSITATLYFFRSSPIPADGDDTGLLFTDPYLTIVLKNTQITQYDLSIEGVDSGGSSETIALAFDELAMTFVHQIDGRKIGQIHGDIKMANKE